MQMNVKTLRNESGKTAVIIAIVLAVIAFLVYPGTSPFKADYYNLKAEGSLKDLHRACNRYWAEGIAAKMVFKATGIKKVVGDCELERMVQDPFNFVKLEGMDIQIIDGSKGRFQATGKHAEGDKVFKVNAQGKIES